MTRVYLEGVSKVFAPEVNAVAGVDLEIPPGELLALVGPSGCGKTTLLRLIAGLESASAGEIRFDDRRMNDTPAHRRNTAMVFQEEVLQPHLNIEQNLAFGLKLRRRKWWQRQTDSHNDNLTNGEITHRIHQAAAAVGIDQLLDRMPQQLSGGQRQRVAIAQAMVRQPAVLLLDEPLSQLDARLRGQLRGEIKRLQQRLGVTTIYVTHDQDEAMALGDRVAVMSAGKIHHVGPPLDVYDHPRTKTVAELLGSPPMNLIAGQLQRTGTSEAGMCFVGGALRVELLAPQAASLEREVGRHVELGVRPEHVNLRNAELIAGQNTNSDVNSLANITMVETLGDSTILRLTTKSEGENRLLTCKQPGRSRWKCGDTVAIQLDPEKVLLFDRESGANLRRSDC